MWEWLGVAYGRDIVGGGMRVGGCEKWRVASQEDAGHKLARPSGDLLTPKHNAFRTPLRTPTEPPTNHPLFHFSKFPTNLFFLNRISFRNYETTRNDLKSYSIVYKFLLQSYFCWWIHILIQDIKGGGLLMNSHHVTQAPPLLYNRPLIHYLPCSLFSQFSLLSALVTSPLLHPSDRKHRPLAIWQ